MYKCRRLFFKLVTILGLFCWAETRAQSALQSGNSPIAFAKLFWTEFDSETPAKIYVERMSPAFKSINAEGAFVQQVLLLRLQAGGPGVGRTFLSVQPVPELSYGVRRDLVLVRLKTRFPNGYVFQDLYVHPNGADWVVDYLTLNPAPPPP